MITNTHIENAKKPTGEAGKATLERMNTSHDGLTNWALGFLGVAGSEKTLLDIGCGGGATIARLQRKFGEDAVVFGLDYSEESVELASEFNRETLGKTCEVLQGDVHALPFEDDKFDVVTAFETVYFWSDLSVALAEVKRVLSPGGMFLVCCEMSDRSNPKWAGVLSQMRVLNVTEWKDTLERHGFVAENFGTNGEWMCVVCKKSE